MSCCLFSFTSGVSFQLFLFYSLACVSVFSYSSVASYFQFFLFGSLVCVAVFSLSPVTSFLNPFSLIHLHVLMQSCHFLFGILFSILSLQFTCKRSSLLSFSNGVSFSVLYLIFICMHCILLSFTVLRMLSKLFSKTSDVYAHYS